MVSCGGTQQYKIFVKVINLEDAHQESLSVLDRVQCPVSSVSEMKYRNMCGGNVGKI